MDTREIEARFKREADVYCPDRYKYIPCFDDFFLRITNFIVSARTPPERVLVLGAEIPALAALYRMYFPEARYVLVDSEENLQLAKTWFSGAENVEFAAGDYSEGLPDGEFDFALSVLSIHRLQDEKKRDLFRRICDRLPEGSVFVNYDQFRASYEFMDAWQNAYWEAQLLESGLSDAAVELWRRRLGEANECSAAAQMDMLRDAGFQAVSDVYTNLKLSVLTAVR